MYLIRSAILIVLCARLAVAQDTRLMARADSLYDARNATAALAAYESILTTNANSYEALWKAARSAIDIGEFEPSKETRTRLYQRARELTTSAVRVNGAGAEGHFQFSRALGRVALAAGVRERVELAEAVRAEALEALKLNPNHDGALHVLGSWNAEIRRLSGFERMMAKTFLGGKTLGDASWELAEQYLKRSADIAPTRIVHRLDLGKVYADIGKKELAREQFDWIAKAPIGDYNDVHYKRLAAEALRRLK